MIAVIVMLGSRHASAGRRMRGAGDERRRHRGHRHQQLGGNDEVDLEAGSAFHGCTVGRSADKCKVGALYLIRTDDPFITNEVLYQLS